MSLNHKNVVRNNDEYFCTVCGRSWEATDRDPPECVVTPQVGKTVTIDGVETVLGLTPGAIRAMASAAPYSAARLAMEAIHAWPTPADPFRELERMMVARGNSRPITPADFNIVVAWIVSDLSDDGRALLVYAPDRHSAQQYAAAVTGRPATVQVERLGGMDKYGKGMATYSELNPRLLIKATKTARREVVSLIQWRRE